MPSVREHYDTRLGPIYGWMLGDFELAKDAARTELRALGLVEGAGRAAMELGAGPGAHAIVLAEAGYTVTAIDTCAHLVEELRAHGGDRVRCVHDDLLHLRRHCHGALDVIVCMGDTLTHLASLLSVERLFEAIAETLKPGGTFVTTFRDYDATGLDGVARFVPVRQDDRRILLPAAWILGSQLRPQAEHRRWAAHK